MTEHRARTCPIRFDLRRRRPARLSPPTFLEELRIAPVKCLTRSTWRYLNSLEPLPPPENPHAPIRVVCISDTHNRKPSLPKGDILIHAGDLTNTGTFRELQRQIDWLASIPKYAIKFVLAGNRDIWLDERVRPNLVTGDSSSGSDEDYSPNEIEGHEPDGLRVGEQGEAELDWKNLRYLQDNRYKVMITKRDKRTGQPVQRAINIMGKPWSIRVDKHLVAFRYDRTLEDAVWHRSIKDDIEIVVTHTPPRFYRDVGRKFIPEGSPSLRNELWRVKPKLHVFGHVHRGRGITVLRWDQGQKAYERACRRGEMGGYNQLVSFLAWLDLCIVIVFGLWGLFKTRYTLDREERKTVLVNAALLYNEKGELDTPIEVIFI